MPFQAHKSLRTVATKSAGNPSTEQLAKINALTLREFAEGEIYVRTAYLAHNAIDRDREVFDDALLGSFANTLPGKGLFVKHPRGWDGDSGPGLGRWFESRVVDMSLDEARAALREPGLQWPPGTERAKLLESSYYVPRSGKNTDLITDIDAGVASDVSIGFAASSRSDIQDGNGNVIAQRLHGPGEALEGSLVWLGAQPGARTVKSADGPGRQEPDHRGNETMNEEQIKAMQTELAALKQQLADLQMKADKLKAISDAVGDLADKPDQLKQAVADGQAFRAELIDDLVSYRRQKGMVGDTPEEEDQAKAVYAAMPIPMLKAERDAWQKQVGGPPLKPTDPNSTGADKGEGEGGGGGLRDSSKTKSALGASDKAA